MRSKKHSCTAVLNGMAKPLWRGEVCPFAQKYAPKIPKSALFTKYLQLGGAAKKGSNADFFYKKDAGVSCAARVKKIPPFAP